MKSGNYTAKKVAKETPRNNQGTKPNPVGGRTTGKDPQDAKQFRKDGSSYSTGSDKDKRRG
jgi:hypothetical protein